MARHRRRSLNCIARAIATGVLVFTTAIVMNLSNRSGGWSDYGSRKFGISLFNGKTDRNNEETLELSRKNLRSAKDSNSDSGMNYQDDAVDERHRVIVEKRQSRKHFIIEGLPEKKIQEVRNLISLTTPSANAKEILAKKVKNIYDIRKKRLMETCEGKGKHDWNDNMQLITVPDKDFTVCVVQKAGSSSWHRLVYKMRVPNGTWTGTGHTLNREHGMHLPADTKQRLMEVEHGTRVLAVRHPFARLISGWNNKFHKNHIMDSTRILEGLPDIEKYIGLHKPDEDHIIAFEDFAQYIADSGLKKVNAHFKSIEDLCRPCDFPYDYITKAETSRDTLWWVLDRIGATMPSFTKHTARGASDIDREADPWDTERKVMSALFHKVPISTVEKLMEIYKKDFHRFGYTFDIDTMMAGKIED